MAGMEIEIGRGLGDAARDVAAALKAAARGTPVAASDRILFQDWDALCAVLTSERFALLRHVRRSPAVDVPALALTLGREFAAVRSGVAALVALGFVARAPDGGPSSAVDEIASVIRIAA